MHELPAGWQYKRTRYCQAESRPGSHPWWRLLVIRCIVAPGNPTARRHRHGTKCHTNMGLLQPSPREHTPQQCMTRGELMPSADAPLLAAPPPQLLRTFELNNDRWCTSKDHAATAAELGQALLDEACLSFKGMLRQLVAATGTAGKRLTSDAYNRPAPAPRTKTLATR